MSSANNGETDRQETAAKPKVKMVRETYAQTTPAVTPVHAGRSLLGPLHQPPTVVGHQPWTAASSPLGSSSTGGGGGSGDFRTIVRVFEDRSGKDAAEIVSVYTDRHVTPAAAASSTETGTLTRTDVGISGPSLVTGGGDRNGTIPNSHRTAPLKYFSDQQNGGMNGGGGGRRDFLATDENDIHNDQRSSSSESFQIQARNAIRSLEEAVDENEDLLVYPGDVVDGGSEIVDGQSATPPAPPPPPPPPPPPFVASQSQAKVYSLAVKRMNWEKLDRVDENTVWANVSPPNYEGFLGLYF